MYIYIIYYLLIICPLIKKILAPPLQASDPARHKKRGAQVKFKESWRALFKWTNSLEQFKHKTENMHAARWREKKQTWERKRRSCSDVESVMVDPVFVCFKYFPLALYLRLQNCRSHWFFLLFTAFSFYSASLAFFLIFLFAVFFCSFLSSFLLFFMLFLFAFFHPFFMLFLFVFSASSPRSLEGLIYSLTYLYLGKI